MNSMKNRMISVKERLGEKLVERLGNTAERIGEQSKGRCLIWGNYEPKIPMELLQEGFENNKNGKE